MSERTRTAARGQRANSYEGVQRGAIDVGVILENAHQFEQRIAAGEVLAGVEYHDYIVKSWDAVIEVLRRLRRIDSAGPATPINDALFLSTCAQFEAGDE